MAKKTDKPKPETMTNKAERTERVVSFKGSIGLSPVANLENFVRQYVAEAQKRGITTVRGTINGYK